MSASSLFPHPWVKESTRSSYLYIVMNFYIYNRLLVSGGHWLSGTAHLHVLGGGGGTGKLTVQTTAVSAACAGRPAVRASRGGCRPSACLGVKAADVCTSRAGRPAITSRWWPFVLRVDVAGPLRVSGGTWTLTVLLRDSRRL